MSVLCFRLEIERSESAGVRMGVEQYAVLPNVRLRKRERKDNGGGDKSFWTRRKIRVEKKQHVFVK